MSIETIEQARALVNEVIEGRGRWNQQFTGADINIEDVFDALVMLREHGEDGSEVTAIRRQLGASKARETKYKKAADEAKEAQAALAADLATTAQNLDMAQSAIRSLVAENEALRNG